MGFRGRGLLLEGVRVKTQDGCGTARVIYNMDQVVRPCPTVVASI